MVIAVRHSQCNTSSDGPFARLDRRGPMHQINVLRETRVAGHDKCTCSSQLVQSCHEKWATCASLSPSGPDGGTRLAENSSDWGIIPRAVQFLFDRLVAASAEDDTFTFSVTCSFMQIYNENLVDLLQDGVRRRGPSLQIREESAGVVGGGARGWGHRRACGATEGGSDTEGEAIRSGRRRPRRRIGLHENRRVFVSGLSSFRVSGAEDVLRYVNLGASNRNVRATQHNEVSSRSHAVMQLVVDSESGGGGEGVNGRAGDGHVTYRQAKLSIVDLAGSEKMGSVLNTSTGHFRELRCINQSLSALGNVVSALSEKGRKHVPYRDSKLTRLLQDSLGGNTRTTIIACVNPLEAHTNETMSTLLFAARAKKVGEVRNVYVFPVECRVEKGKR